MQRKHTCGILLLALALLWSPARAPAQFPSISQILPQPIPAGVPGVELWVVGSDFGQPTDTVRFPGNPPQFVSPTSWGPGSLNVPVPATWSGTIYVFSGFPSPDHPFEVSYSWGGEKWLSLPFTWMLNQNGAPGVTIGDVGWALNVAYDVWECASGVDHSYAGLTALTGANHNDGNNVQYWSTTPWADPGLIAVATYRYNPTTHEIVEADIHYNGADHSWSAGGSATTLDVQHIAAHESGHTIGLLDLYGTADAQKTMYGWASNNQTFARDLTENDTEGAEYLYPHAGRCNYTWATPSGWWGPVVPRDSNDATDTYAPLPATLPGNWPMYVNFAETNNGSDCASPHTWIRCYLDDAYVTVAGWQGQVAAGFVDGRVNNPVTVRSGLHTFRIEYDADDELVESIETDNTYRAQFAWSPYGLADQFPEVRPAPPPAGTLTYPNCEGFMFTGNWWGTVAICPTNGNDDYDLRLHDDYSGSTTGYQTTEVVSQRGAGRTDIVLVNGNVTGYGETRWVGVTEYDAPTGANVVVQQSNQVGNTYAPGTTYGSSTTTGPRILALNQIFKVHEFSLPDNSVTYEFELVNVSGGADLDLAVFDPLVDYHALSDAIAGAASGSEGEDETLIFQPTSSGYHGVAVYKYDSSDLPLAATYELICRVASPNLDATDVPTGHDAPLVPRNATGASSGNVQVTATLDGNATTTYLSYSVEQEGPNDSPQWETRAALDGETILDFAWSGEPVPPTSVQWFDRGPFEVRGGRHTLILRADADDLVTESDESDNVSIRQYVWSPLPVTLGVPVLRDVPPFGGYQAYINCDGMTFTRSASVAWVVVLTPFHQDDDYDLIVYEDYVGSGDGFDDYHAYSPLLQGETDFIVGHYAGTPTTIYAGAVRSLATAYEPYAMDQKDATGRNATSEAAFLTQFMDAFRNVDVYEAYLEAGQSYLFKLKRLGGNDDLRLHLFPSTPSQIYSVWSPHEESTTFVQGQEWILYTATDTGWHPVVVCRKDYRGLDTPLEYNLTWQPTTITGIGDGPDSPATLVFMAPAPNPTSSGSRLGFALPQAGRVRIEIYDVRGRHVRTVADGEYPVGRHAVDWQGRDRRGRNVATGVYYARMEVAGRTLTRRLTVMR